MLDYRNYILKHPRQLVLMTTNEIFARHFLGGITIDDVIERDLPVLGDVAGKLYRTQYRTLTQDFATKARAPFVYAKNIRAHSNQFTFLKNAFDIAKYDEEEDHIFSTSYSPEIWLPLTDVQIAHFTPAPCANINSAMWMCDFYNLLIKMRYFRALYPVVLTQEYDSTTNFSTSIDRFDEDYIIFDKDTPASYFKNEHPYFFVSNVPQTVKVKVHPEDVGNLARWDTIISGSETNIAITTPLTSDDYGYAKIRKRFANMCGIYDDPLPTDLPQLYRSPVISNGHSDVKFPRINIPIVYDGKYFIERNGGHCESQHD